jgi:hypothetical protein
MAAQVVEIADTIREGKKVRTSSKDGSTVVADTINVSLRMA